MEQDAKRIDITYQVLLTSALQILEECKYGSLTPNLEKYKKDREQAKPLGVDTTYLDRMIEMGSDGRATLEMILDKLEGATQ